MQIKRKLPFSLVFIRIFTTKYSFFTFFTAIDKMNIWEYYKLAFVTAQ